MNLKPVYIKPFRLLDSTFIQVSLFFNFLKEIYLFVFIIACVESSLLHAGFLFVAVGLLLFCGVQASHCGGFSCCGAWALGTQSSVVVARGLSSCGSRAPERRLSSCGTQA